MEIEVPAVTGLPVTWTKYLDGISSAKTALSEGSAEIGDENACKETAARCALNERNMPK